MSSKSIKNKCILGVFVLMMGFIPVSCNTKIVYAEKDRYKSTKIYKLDDKNGITHVYSEKFDEIFEIRKKSFISE